MRSVGNAISDFPTSGSPAFGFLGDPNVTLSPSVLGHEIPCPIHIGDSLFFYLDTKCYTGWIPDIVGTNCTIGNASWISDTSLLGKCTDIWYPGPDTFSINLEYNWLASANNDALLDGNTQADTTTVVNAYGPSNDDYIVSLECESECQGECGDANWDGIVNVSDAIWLIDYVFAGGASPQPILACGDANTDGTVCVSDCVRIINYVFAGGDPPEDCSPGAWSSQGGDCCPFIP